MKSFRCLTRIAVVIIGTVIVGACAATGSSSKGGQTETVKSAPALGPEAIVFGRLELVQDGKPVKIGRISTFGMYGTGALLLPESAGTALVLPFDEQGWFAWKLKPGSYFLLGLVSQSGNNTRLLQGDARFNVESDDTIVYVGHVSTVISGQRYRVSFQDSEADARDEIRKRYGDAASPAKRLLQSAPELGTYSGVRSACDKAWGFHCTRDLQGIAPIQPVVARGIHGTTFGRIDSELPTLKWQPTENAGVTYDVAVWEAASYRLPSKLVSDYTVGRLAHYEENVAAAEFTLPKPLKAKTKYFWSVRGRYGDVVSSWSRAGHFTFLLVAWNTGSGEWFAFETP